MAKDDLHKKGDLQDKRNPTQGFDNPFFRDHEHRHVGEEMTITSPVGSVFGDYERKGGTNVMDDVLHEQLPKNKAKSTGKGAK